MFEETKKRRFGAWREILLFAAAVVAFVLLLLFPLAYAFGESEEESLRAAMQSGEIIRLHVIANSDSEEDQAVKLAVRDVLIEAFGQMLREAAAVDCETAYSALCGSCVQMQQTAECKARELGFEGKVTAEAGWMQLPAKTYGSVTLPEGTYRALRVTLGKGEGRNWWCILYPQLCLALACKTEGEIIWEMETILRHWLVVPV